MASFPKERFEITTKKAHICFKEKSESRAQEIFFEVEQVLTLKKAEWGDPFIKQKNYDGLQFIWLNVVMNMGILMFIQKCQRLNRLEEYWFAGVKTLPLYVKVGKVRVTFHPKKR